MKHVMHSDRNILNFNLSETPHFELVFKIIKHSFAGMNVLHKLCSAYIVNFIAYDTHFILIIT